MKKEIKKESKYELHLITDASSTVLRLYNPDTKEYRFINNLGQISTKAYKKDLKNKIKMALKEKKKFGDKIKLYHIYTKNVKEELKDE